MKPISKKILTISVCCMAAGAALGIAGFLLGGRPGITITSKGIMSASAMPGPARMEKQKIGSISDVEICVDSDAKVHLTPSGDDSFYLEYTLDQSAGEPRLNTENGRLSLTQKGGFIGGLFLFGPFTETGGFEEPFSVTLYYPEDASFTSVDISSGSGDIGIQGLKADSVILAADYGDIKVSGSFLGELEVRQEDGDISASGNEIDSLNLKNEYGDTVIEECTVNYAELTAEDGDVFIDAKGLKSLSGTNEYGDTVLVLHDSLLDYGFDLNTEYGDILLPPKASGGVLHSEDEDEMSYRTDGGISIIYTAEDGNISVREP